MDEVENKIIDYASAVFVKNGCTRVTMGDIASGMHISKKTLYEHFSNKEDLLYHCMVATDKKVEERLHEIAEQVNDPLYLILFVTNSLLQSSRRMAGLIRDLYQSYPELIQKKLAPMTDVQFGYISSALEQAQAKGQLRSDVRIDVVMQSLKIITIHLQTTPEEIRDLFWNNYPDYVTVIMESCYSFFRGLLTVDTIKHYDLEMKNYRDLYMSL